MEHNLPAVAESGDLHADHRDPQQQLVQQNLAAGILPVALAAFVVLVVVAAAWTLVVGGG